MLEHRATLEGHQLGVVSVATDPSAKSTIHIGVGVVIVVDSISVKWIRWTY